MCAVTAPGVTVTPVGSLIGPPPQLCRWSRRSPIWRWLGLMTGPLGFVTGLPVGGRVGGFGLLESRSASSAACSASAQVVYCSELVFSCLTPCAARRRCNGQPAGHGRRRSHAGRHQPCSGTRRRPLPRRRSTTQRAAQQALAPIGGASRRLTPGRCVRNGEFERAGEALRPGVEGVARDILAAGGPERRARARRRPARPARRRAPRRRRRGRSGRCGRRGQGRQRRRRRRRLRVIAVPWFMASFTTSPHGSMKRAGRDRRYSQNVASGVEVAQLRRSSRAGGDHAGGMRDVVADDREACRRGRRAATPRAPPRAPSRAPRDRRRARAKRSSSRAAPQAPTRTRCRRTAARRTRATRPGART